MCMQADCPWAIFSVPSLFSLACFRESTWASKLISLTCLKSFLRSRSAFKPPIIQCLLKVSILTYRDFSFPKPMPPPSALHASFMWSHAGSPGRLPFHATQPLHVLVPQSCLRFFTWHPSARRTFVLPLKLIRMSFRGNASSLGGSLTFLDLSHFSNSYSHLLL